MDAPCDVCGRTVYGKRVPSRKDKLPCVCKECEKSINAMLDNLDNTTDDCDMRKELLQKGGER